MKIQNLLNILLFVIILFTVNTKTTLAQGTYGCTWLSQGSGTCAINSLLAHNCNQYYMPGNNWSSNCASKKDQNSCASASFTCEQQCGSQNDICCIPPPFSGDQIYCRPNLICDNGTPRICIQASGAPVVTLGASPITVPSGTASTLSWTVTDATTCTASGDWSGSKNITGGSESTGPLTKNSSFTLNCVNQMGSSSKTVSVNVNSASAVTINLTANPTSISAGGTTILSWAVTGATTNSCTASGGWSGSRALSGSETIGPLAGTTQFFLECTGATGFQTNSVTVTINTGANPPPSSQLCSDGKSISTGIGCIPINNFNSLAGTLIRIAIGIGGGIAFILIAYSGIIIANSTGDPKKLQSGQDLFSAAVSGLLLIIFSIFILRIIGISIFNLPGFGI